MQPQFTYAHNYSVHVAIGLNTKMKQLTLAMSEIGIRLQSLPFMFSTDDAG